METTIILLSGKQGSGKSSIQKELSEQLRKRESNFVITLNFADILYEMHDAVLSILHKYIEPRKIVKDGPLLQLLGTEWGRNTISDNIWVYLLKKKIGIMSLTLKEYKNAFFIIGDCRFDNEFDAFPDKDLPNVLKIRLVASEDVRKIRCSMWRENSTHISEIALDKYYNENKFDLCLDTETCTVIKCVEVIMDNLKDY